MNKASFFISAKKAYALAVKHRKSDGALPYIFLFIVVIIPFCVFVAYEIELLNKIFQPNNNIVSSILVVSGFLGSATIAAMIQIQHYCTKFPFSDFLKEREVFDIILFWPKLVFICNICLMIFCVSYYIISSFITSNFIKDFILLILCCFFIYVSIITYKIISIIDLLTTEYAIYQKIYFEIEKE